MPNRESGYLTKDVAAKRSGRSVRRLLEIASRGGIRKKIIRDANNGNRALTLFHAQDIAALAENPKAPLQISGPLREPPAAMQHSENAEQKTTRPWLTLAEAADYSGLPAGFLAELVTNGKLPALDVGVRAGGRWRVAKRDLDSIAGVLVQ